MQKFSIALFLVVLGCVVAVEEVMHEDLLKGINFHQALSRPISHAQSGVCQDVYTQCAQWKRMGACQSARYTPEAKRSLCGVTCGLCRNNQASNTPPASPANSDDMKEVNEAMKQLLPVVGELVTNLNDMVKAAKAKLAELAQQNA